MNCFFYDEVSNIMTFIKEQNLYNDLCETEISFSGCDFGFDNYVCEISGRFSDKAKKKKVHIVAVDFAKETINSAGKYFLNAKPEDEFLLLSFFDFDKSVPHSLTALSERELTALSEYDSDFLSVGRMVAFENELKKYARNFNIKVLRCSNVFGPEITEMGTIKDILSDFKENNRISLTKNDYKSTVSLSYVTVLLKDVLSVIFKGKKGNVYNSNCHTVTVAEIKNSIYKSFSDKGAELVFSSDEESCVICGGVSSRKIQSINKDCAFSLEDALLKSLLPDESDYISKYVKDCYEGKISRIREEEIGILDEVHGICKDNNINYYLVGGTLLGSVRNKGFIPWDDDVDICMLRDDFEKFRKICPDELNEKYAYQSYRTEQNTHYIYDKIRLKGTYFSSEHSNRYDDMENGIFLDIFVFDKTANSKILQKLHIYLIVMLRRLIHIRWTKEPVSGKFALVSKLILPLVCLLPFSFYHNAFEFILRFFEKSKKSRFVLDGTGLYIKKGALPLEWADGNEPVEFEGRTYPGVKGRNEYLTMWYGKDFITPPEVSKRTSGHIISRLDLGGYAFKNGESSEISLLGELYDK